MNKNDMTLCTCEQCDCHYVQNDCICNTDIHYQIGNEIHYVKKGK